MSEVFGRLPKQRIIQTKTKMTKPLPRSAPRYTIAIWFPSTESPTPLPPGSFFVTSTNPSRLIAFSPKRSFSTKWRWTENRSNNMSIVWTNSSWSWKISDRLFRKRNRSSCCSRVSRLVFSRTFSLSSFVWMNLVLLLLKPKKSSKWPKWKLASLKCRSKRILSRKRMVRSLVSSAMNAVTWNATVKSTMIGRRRSPRSPNRKLKSRLMVVLIKFPVNFIWTLVQTRTLLGIRI